MIRRQSSFMVTRTACGLQHLSVSLLHTAASFGSSSTISTSGGSPISNTAATAAATLPLFSPANSPASVTTPFSSRASSVQSSPSTLPAPTSTLFPAAPPPLGQHLASPVTASSSAMPIPPLSNAAVLGSNPFDEEMEEARPAISPAVPPPQAAARARKAAAAAAAAPADAPDAKCVFHPFNSRMVNIASPLVTQLLSIGFAIDTKSRHIVLADDAVFDAFVDEYRKSNVKPASWGVSTMRAFRKLVLNDNVSSCASAAIHRHQKQQMSLMKTSAVVSSVDQQTAANGLAPDPEANLILNTDQNAVLHLGFEGRNIYLGGSAGTGKSVLLRRLRRELMLRGLSVAMTATTGIAACQIGGTTFHSALHFSHDGTFVGEADELMKFDVIVIDEVSMLSASLLESLDRVLRLASGTAMPFGGVQIILCGDFLQLGPVKEKNILCSSLFHNHFVQVQLQMQVRQDSNSHFYEQLQTMRKGVCPADLTSTIAQHPAGTLMKSAVNLLPTNDEVKKANEEELKKLPGAMMTYAPLVLSPALAVPVTATVLLKTEGHFNAASFTTFFVEAMRCAQGVSTSAANISPCISIYRAFDDTFAMRAVLPTAGGESGAGGVPSQGVDVAAAVTERFHAAIAQIDHTVSIAYGCRVYEIAQDGNGLCTEAVEAVLRKQVEKHAVIQQLSMKLGSRVLLRANLTPTLVNGSIGVIKEFVPSSLETIHRLLVEQVETVLPAYNEFCRNELLMDQVLLPVVEFSNGETLVVPPWKYMVGGSAETDYFGLNTICIPLTLAYAFTVHKVQGLTLYGNVHLELSRMWQCPHLLYVAMSRVRNPDQLSMSAFQEKMVLADAKCVEYESGLPSVHNPRRPTAAHISKWRRAEVGKKMMMDVLSGAATRRPGIGMLQTTNTLTMKKNHLDEDLELAFDAAAAIADARSDAASFFKDGASSLPAAARAASPSATHSASLSSCDVLAITRTIKKEARLKKLSSLTNSSRKVLVNTISRKIEEGKERRRLQRQQLLQQSVQASAASSGSAAPGSESA